MLDSLGAEVTSDTGSSIIEAGVILLLFSTEPKTKREELFDREDEIESLRRSVENYPITLLTGLRRVGKSSLVRVFLNENHYPSLLIDCRKLYVESGGNVTLSSMVSTLEKEMMKFSKKSKISNILKNIKSINLSGIGLEFGSKKLKLTDLFENLNDLAEKLGSRMVIGFDEAQYLRFYGSRGGKDILVLFAYVHDNLTSLRIVVTGSEIGLLHDFLKIDDYDSPIYGRGINEIVLKPFNKELSMDFLRKGFEERGITPDFSLDEVVEKIDGIPGYLVLFGVRYVETRDLEKAMKGVYETMKALFKKELDELRKRSKRYIEVLKLISIGVNTWSKLKRYFYSIGDMISDSRLYGLLQNLMKMSLVEESNGKYDIVDPVLKEVFREL